MHLARRLSLVSFPTRNRYRSSLRLLPSDSHQGDVAERELDTYKVARRVHVA
jgi:hypothetical protein